MLVRTSPAHSLLLPVIPLPAQITGVIGMQVAPASLRFAAATLLLELFSWSSLLKIPDPLLLLQQHPLGGLAAQALGLQFGLQVLGTLDPLDRDLLPGLSHRHCFIDNRFGRGGSG